MRRRTVLAVLAQTPLLSAAALAQSGQTDLRPRLKTQARDALGTTLVLGIPQAPFAGVGHGDDTVIVFVPDKYRFRAEEGLSLLVHFHGHNSSAERAIAAHALREQLVDSRQNAILVVPQLALFAADSSCGKLASPGAFARLLGGALSTAARVGRTTLGDSRFPERPRLGRVCLSAHSGGYHAAACSLRDGGVNVSETYLFDALYAESDVFRDWVLARRGDPAASRHKLVSYFTVGAQTEALNNELRAALERSGVLVSEELREGELSRRDLSHADAVFVRTEVAHSSVTWETNALRDVLYASMLPRHLGSTWFASRDGGRLLERRSASRGRTLRDR
ncbi:MAG TPA: hypothetical protein VNW92_00595 [Polyangiaceae bacterium]|jgi:hypothetical protein|nr:hypothetical protein [Polyangiaceae bacterium]